MQRVGEFEKVSFEQFYGAMKDEFGIGETEAKEVNRWLRRIRLHVACQCYTGTGRISKNPNRYPCQD